MRLILLEALLCAGLGWMTVTVHGEVIDPASTVIAAQGSLQLVREKPEWQRAWTHEAMEPLYNSSLYPDLAVFRARVRLLSALGIANQLKRYHLNNTRVMEGTAVVLVRSGKVQPLTFDNFSPMYKARLDGVISGLQRHHDAGHIVMEDSIFILNLRDIPLCLLGFCLVPLFSPVKEVRNDRAYSDDLLVPLMAGVQEELVYYPADKKIKRGVMTSYKDEIQPGDSSCRGVVQHFAGQELQGQVITMLDTQGVFAKMAARGSSSSSSAAAVEAQLPGPGLSGMPPPAEALSHYAVLLSCDCQTANLGLAALLHTNSIVLKGRSFWFEYYYRALQDGVHFMEFDPGSVFEAVKEALKTSMQSNIQRIVEAGQRFAYTYLSLRSRALYYAKAISEYNKLFGPGYMQATVDALPADRPVTMDDILRLKMYPPSWRQGLA